MVQGLTESSESFDREVGKLLPGGSWGQPSLSLAARDTSLHCGSGGAFVSQRGNGCLRRQVCERKALGFARESARMSCA